VELLGQSSAWNCSAGNCGCNERDQQAQFRRERCRDSWSLLSTPIADHGSMVRQFAVNDPKPTWAVAVSSYED
jgi:hypothetical protein